MGRFWESYLVRYLAGNIFGVIVIFYLFANHSIDMTKSFYGGTIPKDDVNESKDVNISDKVFNFVFQVDRNIALSMEDNKSKLLAEGVSAEGIKLAKIQINELTFVGIFIMGVFGFLYMYLSSLPVYLMHIFRSCVYGFIYGADWSQSYFYNKLAKYRTDGDYLTINRNRVNSAKEYVESYRVMREHGNAFLIIVFEIIFAWLLIQTHFSIYFILGWIAIGSLGWFFSHHLEAKAVIGNEDNSVSWHGRYCGAFVVAFVVAFAVLIATIVFVCCINTK